MAAPDLSARVLASDIDAADGRAAHPAISRTRGSSPKRSPMCGNSICQDRRFLARYMPALERFFHYRNLDVSTLKELAQRWAPKIAEGFRKTSTHLALDDVRESIRELQYYRERLLARSFGEDARRYYCALSPVSARNIQVSTTVSGFSDRLSMPCSTSQRASSG